MDVSSSLGLDLGPTGQTGQVAGWPQDFRDFGLSRQAHKKKRPSSLAESPIRRTSLASSAAHAPFDVKRSPLNIGINTVFCCFAVFWLRPECRIAAMRIAANSGSFLAPVTGQVTEPGKPNTGKTNQDVFI